MRNGFVGCCFDGSGEHASSAEKEAQLRENYSDSWRAVRRRLRVHPVSLFFQVSFRNTRKNGSVFFILLF